MPAYLAAVDLADISPFRIAHVLGTSGVLTGVGVSSHSGYHHFKIEIDSKRVIDSDILDPFSSSSRGDSNLALNLPFKNSLDIYVHSVDTFPQAKFWASFTTDGAEILAEEQVTYAQNELDYEFSRLVMRPAPGAHVYFVETAVRPSRWSKVDLERDTIISGESIRGSLTFSKDAKAAATGSRRRLILRLAEARQPLGYLDISNLRENAEHEDIEFTWPWNDFEIILQDVVKSGQIRYRGRIEFEIVVDIPRSVNYAARFTFI